MDEGSLETCCCGNILRTDARCRVIVHPCMCKARGTGRRRAPTPWLPDDLPRIQYEERKAAGLPVLTDFENAGFREEWR